jgi:hypothetical protein
MHSVFLMLQRCLELKESITRFIQCLRTLDTDNDSNAAGDNEYYLLTNSLIEDGWEDVKELVELLQFPCEMTKHLKGDNSVSGF